MQEITIPDGHKATIVGGTIRIEPIEKQQFKRGDYVIGYIGDIKYACIYDVCYVLMSPLESENVMYAPFGFTHVIKTNKQSIQLLFDALAKEGKYWDADAKEVKDFILVPESIGIYRCKEDFGVDGDGLYIAFNDNTQLLYYNSKYKVWCVSPLHNGYEKVQCKLVSCKREDLKIGDTALCIVPDCTESLKKELADLLNYCKVLNNTDIACISIDKNVIIEQWDYKLNNWYKLTPINE